MSARLARMERQLEALAKAHSELLWWKTEFARRLDTMFRPGKVTDVDTTKHLARIQIGEKDGEVLKSAWLPYGQFAGAGTGGDADEFKFHNPPTVGQQMMMFAPNGEIRQGMLAPYTWSDASPSPSTAADEHVIKYGKLKITMKKDSYRVELGNSSFLMTAAGLTLVGDRIDENP